MMIAEPPAPNHPALPDDGPFRHEACLRLAEVLAFDTGGALAERLDADAGWRSAWLVALGASRFFHRLCLRYPTLVADFLAEPDWLAGSQAPAAPMAAADPGQDRDAFMGTLRRERHWHLARIAFRDLAGWAGFAETAAELTALAEAALEAALSHAHADLTARFGQPRTPEGEVATFTVLGMGKLGGGELNFSSDIDLIFAYTDDGETDGERPRENAKFFTRLGREIVHLLAETTADGFAYRVDMRLRPHGDAGPLAQPLAAIEQYYQVHGREWERYAMVKARPIAGDRPQGEALLEDLRPFVYRRFLDFGAVEAVRDIKAQIQRQVAQRRFRGDIKLGRGGIREIEFIVQAFQLLHGGRMVELRQRPTLTVLAELVRQDLLPERDGERLRTAYLLLRDVENRLQMAADEQTQRLPDDDSERRALARTLGYTDDDAFHADLEEYRTQVHEAFDQTFAAPQTDRSEEDPLERLWLGEMEEGEAERVLADHGYLRPTEATATLDELRSARFVRHLSATGRSRLDRLMPLVIGAAGNAPSPSTALARVAEVLEAIGGRTTYFALLGENPVALAQVVRLCGASPFLARFLGRHPMLLDEILDPGDLYACRIRPSREAALSRELETSEDMEERLNALRRFRNIEVLHLAARDLQGHAGLDEVSRGLSEVAELSLEQALALAWAELTERFGVPRCVDDGVEREAGFLIAGMGKLGGGELGYGSDLDLLFLHDSRGENQATTGGAKGQSLDNARFFARLGQRLIHFVTTLTAEGALYSIDMRLRPGGKSGPLVASLDHFRNYQASEAWTWEHQALLRGRPVAGDAALGRAFDRSRLEVLATERDPAELAAAVCDMRGRMLAEHASQPGVFNIKRDRGGLIDVEFLVQYLCLRHAHRHPAILANSTLAALTGLADHDLLPGETARALNEAYTLFRTLENRIKLFEDRAEVEVTADPTWREQLDRLADPEQRPVVPRLEAARDEVIRAFDELLGPPQRRG